MDAEAEITRLKRQRAALAQFGLLAFRSQDLDEILHRAAELVSESLSVRYVKVLELLPPGDRVLVRAGVGWRPGVVGRETFGADHQSPAGYALEAREPVVSCDVDAETRFEIPRMLREHGVRSMVNVVIVGEHEPFGVLEVDAPEKREFGADEVDFLRTYANLLAAAIDRLRAHEALERSHAAEKMLTGELSHRVKNLLGLVQSLAMRTGATGPDATAFRDAFVARLQALSRAENLALGDGAQSVDLAELVAQAMEPFQRAGGARARGASLPVSARSGRMLSLVLHELATNAVKHGALSDPTGQVRIAWSRARNGVGRRVLFRWSEEGGPGPRPSARRGFGTRLLTQLAEYELDGEAVLNFRPQGLLYELSFPERPAEGAAQASSSVSNPP